MSSRPIETNVLRGPDGQQSDLNKKVGNHAAYQDAASISLVPDKYNNFSTLELDV